MEKIIYEKIPDLPEYRASSDGHIFDKNGHIKSTAFIHSKKDNGSILYVSINSKRYTVANLIGSAFIINDKDYSFKHKDNNPLNNSFRNLVPVRRKRQLILQFKNGTKKEFDNLKAASKYLGKNLNYLSHKISINNSPYIISNGKFICRIELR